MTTQTTIAYLEPLSGKELARVHYNRAAEW